MRLVAGVALASSLVTAGCNYIGAAYVLAAGTDIDAVFELDANRTTVVLIDDLNNRVPRRSLRDRIGRTSDAALLQHKVVKEGNLISSESARRVAASGTSEDPLSAVDIGRRVGAEVVIYVTMTGWTLQQEPGLVSPTATAQVRILDAVHNVRLWPEGEMTYPLTAKMARRPGSDSMSLSDKAKYEQMLAVRFGEELAKMFYRHERDRISNDRGF